MTAEHAEYVLMVCEDIARNAAMLPRLKTDMGRAICRNRIDATVLELRRALRLEDWP